MRDDGKGFDTEKVFAATKGLGLLGMKQSVESLRGACGIKVGAGARDGDTGEAAEEGAAGIMSTEVMIADDHTVIRDGLLLRRRLTLRLVQKRGQVHYPVF